MSCDIWTRNMWAWPLATMEIWRRAFDMGAAPPDAEAPAWTTPARRVLQLGLLRLWDFSTEASAHPAIVLSPYALHGPQLADLAPGHSLIETLLRAGCTSLYLVEWVSATEQTRLYGIDHLLAELNVAIDEIGAPVDLIGLCQGGWLSLLYAARFPKKTRRLVVAGAPVDVTAECSALSGAVEGADELSIERLVDLGGGIVRGRQMWKVWPREESEQARIESALQIELRSDSASAFEAIAAFRKWDRRVLDLPGVYFREVFRRLYRGNLLARCAFPALGKEVDLRGLDKPLFLLAGGQDSVSPPAQVLAAAALTKGASEAALAPCSHLALFMGRRTLGNEWPRIARWLTRKETPP